MKTDNKITNKTEYAEMVKSSIAPRILSEAANHTFEKRSSPASAWVAAACFALIFAAAAIFLFKPKTERGEAANGTPAPDTTKTVQTTPDASFTPVPTPDISNMRIIYGSGYAYGIDDMEHKPGTVTLYGGLTEMLADEQYNNCVFAVHIDIQDRYIENMYSDMYSEEFDRLYEEFQNDPAVVRYNELYESFVQENADRYGEFLEQYYYPSEFHGDFDSRKKELEWLAEKYDESMVFQTAFGYYLDATRRVTDGPYLEQLLLDYGIACQRYQTMRSEFWQDHENRPEVAELFKARHDAEVERLKDCGLISKEYVYDGKTMLYWLLTRDQLLNFPASPEFAYIITPAPPPDDAPAATALPSKPIGSDCDPYCMENWETMYRFFKTADENGVTNGEKCFKNYDSTMTAFWGTERGSEADSWLTWKAIGTAMPDELYLTDIYLAGTEDAPLQLIYQRFYYAGDSLESFICKNVTFDRVSIENESTIDCDSMLKYVSGIHAVNDAVLKGEPVSRHFNISSETHCRCESNGRLDGAVNDRLAFTIDLISAGGGSVGVSGGRDGDGYIVMVYAAPKAGHSFIGWYDAEGSLISTEETFEISYIDENGGGVHDFTATARFEAQASIDEAQAEHIINLLAEYHAAQFTRSAQLGELKLSESVLSELEERQRCIEEMEKRICVYSGKFMSASFSVERLDIAPTYDVNGSLEGFIATYYEITTVDYGVEPPFSFGIDHTVTIAPDGTVLHDYFSEENSTGFSNHPFPNSGIIWTDAEIPASYYTSERYQYLAAAHALLAGEVPERTDFSYGGQYVHFRLEDDGLKAYVTVIDAASGEETEVTVAIIPREVGERAVQRLNEYWDEYVYPSEHGEDTMPEFDGFIGENHFVLATLDDSMQDLQVHCIFCFDGSEWREITGCPGLYTDSADGRRPYTIHGACVLDENTALLCYYSKHLFYEGAQDNKLHIYRTENGGESWSRLDIELPDYYTNRMSYYAPLTPVFDESGMHGVIILDSGIMTNGESAPFGWLESRDGGISWEFRSLEG